MRTKARIIASRPRKLNSRHGPDFSTLLPCVVACDGAPHCRCSREQIISSVAFSSRANGSAVVPSESGLLFTVPEGAAFVGDDGNDHYSPNGHPFIMRLHQRSGRVEALGCRAKLLSGDCGLSAALRRTGGACKSCRLLC
jgi:hypothetical protein